MSLRVRRVLALSCVVVMVPATGLASGVKKNPENDKSLGPTATPGYFTGYPTPTYEYHGCKLTSRSRTAVERIPGMPAYSSGTKQSAVTFVVNPDKPYVTWRARAGYRICGAQISALLSSPDDDTSHVGGLGYTSGATKGATVRSGSETIKVRVSKKDANSDIARTMGGKTYSIGSIFDVTVFVRKK